MKNNIKFYGFLTLLLVLVSACHSDLDRLPQSNLSQDNFYNDLTELEIGLAGVYDVMAKTKDGYGEGFIKMGVHGSHVATTFVGATKQNTQAWFTFDNSEESFNRVWGSAYKLIYRANQVIDRAALLGAADDVLKNRMVAEAKFLRALMYFNLVRFWGDVPLIKEELTNLNNASSPRVSSKEIYDFIIEDLIFAEANLFNASWVASDKPSYSEADLGRATIGAAKGMLAKVYLTIASYPLKEEAYYKMAYDKAKEVVSAGDYVLDNEYATLFTLEGEGSREWMFQVQHDYDLLQPGVWGGVNSPGGNKKALDWGNGRTTATLELLNHYDIEDPRFIHNIAQGKMNADNSIKFNKNQNQSYSHKFRFSTKSVSSFNTSMNVPVLRYADVVLVYAEAAANLGLDGDAFDALDMIRNRARGSQNFDLNNVDFLPSAGTTPLAVDRSLTSDALFDEIMWDRAKELCFEGTAKFDVFRLGETKFLELMQGQQWDTDLSKDTNPLKDVPWANNVQPKHTLFPIPEAEVAGNKFISSSDNNPGW